MRKVNGKNRPFKTTSIRKKRKEAMHKREKKNLKKKEEYKARRIKTNEV